jgi:hypothetical protein
MTTDIDHKAGVDTISDDVVPTAEPGHGSAHGKLEPPPLVAAMSQQYRLEAEARLRKKVDTRLLPMIILMYIMNYLDRKLSRGYEVAFKALLICISRFR